MEYVDGSHHIFGETSPRRQPHHHEARANHHHHHHHRFDTSHEILHYTIWWCAVTYLGLKKIHTNKNPKIRRCRPWCANHIYNEWVYVWSGDPTTRIPARITVECIPTTCCHFIVFVFKSWKSKHGGRFLRHLEAPLAGNEKLLAFWWDKCYNKKILS